MPVSAEGKQLHYIFTSPDDVSNRTDLAAIKGIIGQFPIEDKRYILELKNVFVDKKSFTKKDEKEAILKSKSLTYPIRGDLILKDKATGKVLDEEKNFALMDSFAMTGKHTMVYNGNNYAIANLLLLKQGVYHRYKSNDELMAQVNTEVGSNLNVELYPKTQQFILNIGNVNVPLLFVLSEVFHVDKAQAAKYIPSSVWDLNLSESTGKEERYINLLFNKVVPLRMRPKTGTPSYQEKLALIKAAIERSTLDVDTTAITLGKSFSHVSPEVLLITARNLIDIHQGKREEDNRDSLVFKKVHNLPDFISRRFQQGKEHENVTDASRKMKRNLEFLDHDNPKIKNAVVSKPYNKVFQKFVTDSTLSFTPSETNPIDSLETVAKATVLGQGEGGIDIKKARSVKTRNIDPTHLGILDPSRTPESENAGVDLRFTINAARDEEGNMYARVIDRAGKFTHISTRQIISSIIGFPGQDGKEEVQAQAHGVLKNVHRKDVDYWLPAPSDTYTITTNLVPFLNSNHPGRLTMAGKAITQALSLKERQAPLVSTSQGKGSDRTTYTKFIGSMIATKSPVNGIVRVVDAREIKIYDSETGNIVTVPFVKNLPFNQKGFLDDEKILVKVGDRITKGQCLVDNNYTIDGELSLGKNLTVAYLPYKGYNHEDGLVISHSAAKGLDSLHAYKYDYSLRMDTVTSKALFHKYFPDAFTSQQLTKLDDRGFVLPGTKLMKGDPIWALLEKRTPTAEDKMYGRLHKSLVKPFNQVVEHWEHEEPGEVVDIHTESKNIRVVCRSVKPLEIGDKLTGLHGNKGIVSLILPDSKMPYNKETGKPVDMLLNPASVTSRINLGQVMETVAGRIAQKTGKQYQVNNFSNDNNLKTLRAELAHHGLQDSDTIVDPVTGSEMKNVLGGPQYILKLYKTTDQNYSARNIGGYDSWKQPTKGGEEGSKRSAYMEFLGLLGSDARKNLKEMATLKSEENTDFWHKFMTGQPLPKPKMTFATQKFFDYLKASGIDVRTDHDTISLAPTTDHKILQMSNGEVKPLRFNARNMEPDKGGLYDIAITGGPTGNKWSHYTLAEPIVNPLFESPVKSILGLSAGEYDGLVSGAHGVQKTDTGVYTLFDTSTKKKMRDLHIGETGINTPMIGRVKKASSDEYDEDKILVGGNAFRTLLGEIHTDKALKAAVDNSVKATSVSRRNDEIDRAKYLMGLKATGFSNPADAYTIRHMPVIPPVMRPAIDQGGNNISFADANQLYVDHMNLNKSLSESIHDLPAENLINERKALYDGASAVVGLGEPIGAKKTLKGFIKQIAGEGGPKTGVFHDKLLSKKQDFSGRATIYAAPDVGFNEAKFPVDQLWMMYKMHIIRDLTRQGYTLAQAKTSWEKRDPYSTNSFNKVIKDIPMIINRAPTLMRTNIMAMYPVPVQGKTLGLNILHLPGFAADFDGDAMTVHVPMTPEAIHEAKEKLLPMHHLNDARRGHGVPMFAPGHEAILGSVRLTEPDAGKNVIKFKTEEEALAALKAGKISDNQPIEIAA